MQNQIDQIEKVIIELHKREQAYRDAAMKMADAEVEYKRARAMIYLNADGTIADRNAQADVETWELHKAKIAAEATLALTKAMLDDARAVLSARQSILSAQAKTNLAIDFASTKQI